MSMTRLSFCRWISTSQRRLACPTSAVTLLRSQFATKFSWRALRCSSATGASWDSRAVGPFGHTTACFSLASCGTSLPSVSATRLIATAVLQLHAMRGPPVMVARRRRRRRYVSNPTRIARAAHPPNDKGCRAPTLPAASRCSSSSLSFRASLARVLQWARKCIACCGLAVQHASAMTPRATSSSSPTSALQRATASANGASVGSCAVAPAFSRSCAQCAHCSGVPPVPAQHTTHRARRHSGWRRSPQPASHLRCSCAGAVGATTPSMGRFSRAATVPAMNAGAAVEARVAMPRLPSRAGRVLYSSLYSKLTHCKYSYST